MPFDTLITGANNLVWSLPLVGLLLITGLYFSLRTLFLQIRCIPDMLEQLRKGESSPDGTSSLQSLMIPRRAASAWATSVASPRRSPLGGPGAVFWMWLIAFLGAATSFIECTLGQIYKEKDLDTGEYRGGPGVLHRRRPSSTPRPLRPSRPTRSYSRSSP